MILANGGRGPRGPDRADLSSQRRQRRSAGERAERDRSRTEDSDLGGTVSSLQASHASIAAAPSLA